MTNQREKSVRLKSFVFDILDRFSFQDCHSTSRFVTSCSIALANPSKPFYGNVYTSEKCRAIKY